MFTEIVLVYVDFNLVTLRIYGILRCIYFTLGFWLVFCQIFRESLTYLCYVKILNQNQVQGLIPVKSFSISHDTLSDNDNLWIPSYELIRVDHQSNKKRGGICIYHKDFLPVKVNNVSCLKECLNFNLSVHGKQCDITLIYRSLSQSSKEFYTFLSNFKLLLDSVANRNPFVSIIIGDLNARS